MSRLVDQVRLFLAGELPKSLTAQLVERLRSVRAATPQARWLPAEGLHLTLLFLGELEARVVPDLASAFNAVAHRHGPLALRVSGACTFGPPRRPRVLAAELAGDLRGLGDLFADASREVQHLVKIESDRPFRPHVTLARARSSHGDPLLGRCRTALNEALSGEFVLERLTLYRSELLASGAAHTPVAAWLLGQHAGHHEHPH